MILINSNYWALHPQKKEKIGCVSSMSAGTCLSCFKNVKKRKTPTYDFSASQCMFIF